jgi:hypothetical protein
MDEPYFIRPGEGERIRQHRVLAELPQIEALELSYGPHVGFIGRLRED